MVKMRPTKWSNAPGNNTSARLLLAKNTRKLGDIATSAFFEIKQVLNKDITPPNAVTNLIGSLPFVGQTTPRKATKKSFKATQADRIAQLKNDVKKSHEVLARSRSIWPFALFPDDIILDRTKVTIVKRDFFWSSNVLSVRIEDVLNVAVGTGPFFGTLSIAIRIMNSTDHYSITFLPKSEAIHLKHIVQGYVIAQHNKIDTSHLNKQELIDTLCELGTDSNH